MGDLVVSSAHPKLSPLASLAGCFFSTQHLNVGLPQNFPQIFHIPLAFLLSVSLAPWVRLP